MRSSNRGAALVAIGVFCSRIAGFIRESLFAHYFGNSDVADAFKAALRIPNFLQNLLGEGVLGASFIPVYSRLLHGEEERSSNSERSSEYAYAVGFILVGIVTVISCGGVLGSSFLVNLITPGFEGEKRELTVSLVQLLFPATAALVLSAWCLGVLNSHRKFLLSYLSPVMWNGVIIGALLLYGTEPDGQSAIRAIAWGVLLGSLAQWIVQMPAVFRLLGPIRARYREHGTSLRQTGAAFLPTLLGRGVVQISAFVDSMFASLLSAGALSSLTYAQMIYLLPLSLFAAPISAAELPELSRGAAGAAGSTELLQRLEDGVRRIAFFLIPTLFVFLLFGRELIRALYQSGSFSAEDTFLVSSVLAGMTIGLIPNGFSRIYSSLLYALGSARLVVQAATLRVLFGTALGGSASLKLPELLGWRSEFGIVLLVAGSSIAAWIELALLVRAVNRQVGVGRGEGYFHTKLFFLSGLSAAGALLITPLLPVLPRGVELIPQLGIFGALYLGLAAAFKVPEVSFVLRILRKIAASRG